MQVHQPLSGAAEASTKPARIRPTMASHGHLDLPNYCDVCGRIRSAGGHQACSRIRQKRKAAEWGAYMAEQDATRAAKQERRRYER